jgi:hypothetical protein
MILKNLFIYKILTRKPLISNQVMNGIIMSTTINKKTENKKQKIKESIKKTKEKRRNQIPKVCELKISYSNLNKKQKE